MPWTCPSCSAAVVDDALVACPACGQRKTSWTIVGGVTRTLRVGGTKVRVLRGTSAERPADAGAYDAAEWVVADEVQGLPAGLARDLASRGVLPAPREVVLLRFKPDPRPDRGARVTLPYAKRRAEDLRYAPPPDAAAAEAVELRFACVFGAGAADVSFPGLTTLDVTDRDGHGGHLTQVQVGALGRPPHPVRVVVSGGGRCLDIEGPHFDFDRSFLRPDGVAAVGEIARTLAADPARRGGIFGHTDTVGTEDYNKLLSERRARAVLAALTHDADAWEALHQDEGWGLKAVQSMLASVLEAEVASGELEPIEADGVDGPRTRAAVEAFQARPDHAPLDVDGVAGPLTRRELYLAYTRRGVPAPVDPAQLLDVGGGARHMGCGEMNPFSIEGRDEQSRRVCALVFDQADAPTDLPCRLGDLGPCRANALGPGEAPEHGAEDPRKVHFRCRVFRKLSMACGGHAPEDPWSDGRWHAPDRTRPTPGEVDWDPANGTLDLFLAPRRWRAVDETYLLESPGGEYRQSRRRSEAYEHGPDLMAIQFTGVRAGLSYSLARAHDAARLWLFRGVPIEELDLDRPETPPPPAPPPPKQGRPEPPGPAPNPHVDDSMRPDARDRAPEPAGRPS